MPLSKELKFDIITAISEQKDAFGKGDFSQALVSFIGDIFQLRNMPSQDSRYDDAEQDFYQHLIRNDDWTIDYVFLDRLGLKDDDQKFLQVIQHVMEPKFRNGPDDIMRFVLLLDPYLENVGLKFALLDFDQNNNPIYKISEKEEVDLLPPKVKQNQIQFFVQTSATRFADNPNSHKNPSVYPSFVLVFNAGWNDFSFHTSFYLFYYDLNKMQHPIGETKIIREEIENSTIVPDVFTNLSENYCSLGQTIRYYQNLKSVFKQDFESILFALKDAAFFSRIQERFENQERFKQSLIRSDIKERLLREARFIVYDFDLSQLYRFRYSFKAAYAESPVEIEFNFESDKLLSNRIFGLIGENGTGKTQLISSLPINIAKKENHFFSPKAPVFSKVIAVSYSVFDRHEIPRSNAEFNYIYCGLMKNKKQIMSPVELDTRFKSSWTEIFSKGRNKRWQNILKYFLDKELVEQLGIIHFEGTIGKRNWKINTEGYNSVKDKLSSGQNILLYIITEITAHIRFDSLIIYDEPETHLHPNAISQLMNAIYVLSEDFQSYFIIATHSPLVVREIPAKSVYVLERNGNEPSIRKIKSESLGENETTLTEEIFGNKSVEKKHEMEIRKLIRNKLSYEGIMEKFRSDNIPMNLNMRMLIKEFLSEEA